MSERHTGFGDCACDECFPTEPEFPLADHGEPVDIEALQTALDAERAKTERLTAQLAEVSSITTDMVMAGPSTQEWRFYTGQLFNALASGEADTDE